MRQLLKSFIAVLILFILFGTAVYVNIDKDSIDLCSNDEECLNELITMTSDYGICLKFSNPQDCYLNFAIKNSNVDLCSKTSDLDKCVFQIAFNEENYEICSKSIDSDLCMYSYALAKGKINICEELNNYKDQCLNEVDNERDSN